MNKISAVFNWSYTTELSYNCLCVVCPHAEVYCTFGPAVRGLTEELCPHAVVVLSVFAVGDSCLFVIPAQWKNCLKVDLAEALPNVETETGCFHITRGIPHIFFFFFFFFRDLSP